MRVFYPLYQLKNILASFLLMAYLLVFSVVNFHGLFHDHQDTEKHSAQTSSEHDSEHSDCEICKFTFCTAHFELQYWDFTPIFIQESDSPYAFSLPQSEILRVSSHYLRGPPQVC